MELYFVLLVYVVSLLLALLILFFVVKGAVLEALKEHTRWTTKYRDALEAKYATPTTVQGHIAAAREQLDTSPPQ